MTKKSKLVGKNVSKQKKPRETKKWIVAVDPFSGLALNAVFEWTKHRASEYGSALQAVFVLGPASLNWTGDFSGPWFKKYRPLAETKLADDFPLQSVTVVTCKEASMRATVKTFLRAVQKAKAECIVAATHARHGIDRLLMGSFTETLLLMSKIPVLVVPPQSNNHRAVKRILAPVELAKANKKFRADLILLAKRFGAEVVLFHKLPDPLDPIIQQGVYSLGGGWVSVQSYLEQGLASTTESLRQLQAEMIKHGVPTTHVLDSSPQALVDSIHEACKVQKCDLIALQTKSGPWSSALLGSVARSLVRTAQVPVWIQH
jgi:nucleotide-binding universal stress UspA family protein